MAKKYTLKVYDKAGTTFLGTYGQLSDYSFSSTINGGVGELRISLPRKFDEYNTDGTVALLDHIQLWVQDNDSNGVKIYSGYIDEIERKVTGSQEVVIITCLGYTSRLGFSVDTDGTNAVIKRNSQDPTAIIKDIIDKYIANYTNPFINYTASSTENTGLTVTYQSDTKYCVESIERIRQMAGANWYWYVDADNVLYFKSKPTTPTHTFIMGKDISELTVKSVASDIKNALYFWNGLQATDANFLQKRYYSPSSIASYWERAEKNTDSRIEVNATALAYGDAFIEANKAPNSTITFQVKDNNFGNGYDIESVKCGDTCRILNVGDSDLYNGNFQITSIFYTPEYITVTVEDKLALTGRMLSDIRRSLDTTTYSDGVSSITSVNTD
jgi:hypothetical protein